MQTLYRTASRILVILSILFFTGVVFLWSTSARAQEQSSQRFGISLRTPRTIDEVVQATSKNGAELVSIHDTFLVDGIPTTDFYFVQPNKRLSRDILDDYRAARQGMLVDMENNRKEMMNNISVVPEAVRARVASPIKGGVGVDRIDVEGIEVIADSTAVEAVARTLGTTFFAPLIFECLF